MAAGAFDIVIVAQAGRLQYEALILAASLRAGDPGFAGRLLIAEPRPGPLWPSDPRIRDDALRGELIRLGATFLPFDSRAFGAGYPQGNKIEALLALEPGRPFLFLDTDTLITGPVSEIGFDFARPSASMAREGTWPVPPLYGPGYTEIWRSLYEMFGLDFASSLDPEQPDEHWRRYLYFNAGWFFFRDGPEFGARFLEIATAIRDRPPETLACQSLDPWLDQAALPLVIHSFGGGRPGPELDGLDGRTTCHWRALPLFYARASDQEVGVMEAVTAPNRIKRHLRLYEPMRRMLYQRRGHKARALFAGAPLPRQEKALRNRLRKAGLWMR